MTMTVLRPCWLWVKLAEPGGVPTFGPRLQGGETVEVLKLGDKPRHWHVLYEGKEYLIYRMHVQ